MQRVSSRKQNGMQVRAGGLNVKSMHKAGVLAIAAAFVITTGTAFAQFPAVKEDQAQLKADESALVREEAQLRADQKTLVADSKSGKMAAESPDAERVYKDQRAVKGQKKDIAADKAKVKGDQKK